MAPQNQEDTSLPKTDLPNPDLPNPDLNPLMNPMLGRNLGRWAQVYFTSPPEKREEAVVGLLRELQAQSGKPTSEKNPDAAGKVESIAGDSVLCAECGYQNPKPQRFCGMCGTQILLEEDAAGKASMRARRDEASKAQTRVRETVMPSFSLFADTEDSGSGVIDDTPSEVRWLRASSSAYQEPSGSGGSMKYLLVIAVLLLAGGLFYVKNRRQEAQTADPPAAATHNSQAPQGQLSSGAWVSAPPAEPSVTEIPPAPAENAANTTEPGVIPEPPSFPAEGTTQEKRGSQVTRSTRPAQPVRAGTTLTAASIQPETVPDAAGGSTELAIAENYLIGKNSGRNSELAARLLWRAVAKENTTAILLLSNLYLAGDGVPKSCAQARLLLKVAARKNVPEAATKLRGLNKSGCP